MAVAIYNTEELTKIASYSAKKISRGLAGMTAKQVLLLRRNLQISLAAYATKNPSRNGKLDPIHGGIVWVCRQIEMRAREAFMAFYFPRIWPEAKAKGISKLMVKQKLLAKWETLLARTGY